MRKIYRFFWFTIIIFLTFNITFTTNYSPSFAYEEQKITLDLFTQKEPYNGKGFNQSSDMFGPQEEVQIYALLTADGGPICGKLVSFEVCGPIEVTQDIKFHLAAKTNCSGIATINFSLAVINQTDAFGTWVVTGRVEVNNKIFMDILTFQVKWIIELLHIKTIDDELNNRVYFGIGGDVGFKISLRNNAMSPKTAFIAITIFDELNVPINSLYINNFVIPPYGKIQHLYQKMPIPKFAVPGKAKIFVVALDNQNVAYCPAISTDFWLTIYDPILLDFIDGAIAYATSTQKKTTPGKPVEITVIVRNEGTTTLNDFYVSVHANASFIDSRFINKLEPLQSKSLSISWKTSGQPEGQYTVNIAIQNFPNETDLSDNTYSFRIELTKPILIPDIQVLRVDCSSNEVFKGEIVTINVTVKNNGNATVSSKLRTYYDNFLIQEKDIRDLTPATTELIAFKWNTTSAPAGEYRIIAIATPAEGETNTEDNTAYGCLIIIKDKPPQIIHDVAITFLNAQPSELEIGGIVEIKVQVRNFGSEPEAFDIRLFYDNFLITILEVNFLAPSAILNLKYFWNTSQVIEGNYTIKGNIPPVEGEEEIGNNELVDGKIWIKKPQALVKKHDIAIPTLNVTRKIVNKGETVEIIVTVANLGDFNETFNIFVYANMSEIWSYRFVEVKAKTIETISFTWNTTNEKIGKYTIWAKADSVIGETDINNNLLVDGILSIVKPPSTIVHDIGIIELYADQNEVKVGKNVTIKMIVVNLGSSPESFNITIYYDSKEAGTISIISLGPSTAEEVIFYWDTQGVVPGTYTLSANTTVVEGEVDIENNRFVDGNITIKPIFEVSFLMLIAPFLIGLAIILLLIFLYYIIRKKVARSPQQLIIIGRPRL